MSRAFLPILLGSLLLAPLPAASAESVTGYGPKQLERDSYRANLVACIEGNRRCERGSLSLADREYLLYELGDQRLARDVIEEVADVRLVTQLGLLSRSPAPTEQAEMVPVLGEPGDASTEVAGTDDLPEIGPNLGPDGQPIVQPAAATSTNPAAVRPPPGFDGQNRPVRPPMPGQGQPVGSDQNQAPPSPMPAAAPMPMPEPQAAPMPAPVPIPALAPLSPQ